MWGFWSNKAGEIVFCLSMSVVDQGRAVQTPAFDSESLGSATVILGSWTVICSIPSYAWHCLATTPMALEDLNRDSQTEGPCENEDNITYGWGMGVRTIRGHKLNIHIDSACARLIAEALWMSMSNSKARWPKPIVSAILTFGCVYSHLLGTWEMHDPCREEGLGVAFTALVCGIDSFLWCSSLTLYLVPCPERRWNMEVLLVKQQHSESQRNVNICNQPKRWWLWLLWRAVRGSPK